MVLFSFVKEEQLKGRPGYEHLSEPLHILIEAELPANVIDSRLAKAQEILEELLKPVVCICFLLFSTLLSSFPLFNLQLISNICRNIKTETSIALFSHVCFKHTLSTKLLTPRLVL
jgi:hypothetical protein